jgi:hypothetical protein
MLNSLDAISVLPCNQKLVVGAKRVVIATSGSQGDWGTPYIVLTRLRSDQAARGGLRPSRLGRLRSTAQPAPASPSMACSPDRRGHGKPLQCPFRLSQSDCDIENDRCGFRQLRLVGTGMGRRRGLKKTLRTTAYHRFTPAVERRIAEKSPGHFFRTRLRCPRRCFVASYRSGKRNAKLVAFEAAEERLPAAEGREKGRAWHSKSKMKQ